MSRLDMSDAEYEASIADMVLVDTALNTSGDEVFVIKHGGECKSVHDDIIEACDHAKSLASVNGVRWDVTIQARNAGDME